MFASLQQFDHGMQSFLDFCTQIHSVISPLIFSPPLFRHTDFHLNPGFLSLGRLRSENLPLLRVLVNSAIYAQNERKFSYGVCIVTLPSVKCISKGLFMLPCHITRIRSANLRSETERICHHSGGCCWGACCCFPAHGS